MNFKLYLAATAALTLAACSSDEPAGNQQNTDNAEAGYLALSIQLPTAEASRADDFSDGLAAEYDVKDATLVVFKKAGANEFAYTFVESTPLTNLQPWSASTDEQVTVSATAVAKLNNVSVVDGSQYYGLVVVNNASTGMALPTSGTFGEWLNAAQTVAVPALDKGLYMTNAPAYTAAGQTPATLVALDTKKMASSAATATEIGATIFVERGVAKVTMASATFNKSSFTEGTYNGATVTIQNWALDITNKTTFPCHNVDGLATSYSNIWSNDAANHRFVKGNGTFVRTMWAKDPNYDKNIQDQAAINAAFNVVGKNDVKAGKDAALYCWENTFDINHMLQGQTTRVVFKALFTPAGFEGKTGDDATFFRTASQPAIYSLASLQTLIKGKAVAVCGTNDVTVTLTDAITKNAGNHQITADMVKVNGAAVTDAQLAAIKELAGITEGINTYLHGESYYVARVKHFGDAETPWDKDCPTYGGDNAKYLGRYGMVRNNWYELSVTGIAGPGDADVPTIKPNEPDDETDIYVSITVKVLPWAKHVQNVEL